VGCLQNRVSSFGLESMLREWLGKNDTVMKRLEKQGWRIVIRSTRVPGVVGEV
jgi:hypothetical protein